MEAKDETLKMRKRNMKLFPIYKMFGWDFLFFYTIDFLFLTQVKGISAADVVLKTTFFSVFGIIMQIPANIIVEFLGRKNATILANIFNCIYMVIIMMSRSFYDLLLAELFYATAYAIKNVTETSILSESIPKSKYKSKIFSSINGRGASRYYLLNSISKVIAGFLFQVNGYLPLAISLGILIISVILSMFFIEPVHGRKKIYINNMEIQELKDIKQGFKFVLKSERLKALILSYGLISSIIQILMNYHVSLLEEIGISAAIIGLISATKSLISSYASKTEHYFHTKFRNKSITTIALMLSLSTIIAGICGLKTMKISIIIIIAVWLIYGYAEGMYMTIRDKYLSNFSNKKIDTKIYAVSQLTNNIAKVIGGLIASFLLDRMRTAYCMIIIGIIFTILFILTEKYMKTRVGLKPEQYSKEERKYDELAEHYGTKK